MDSSRARGTGPRGAHQAAPPPGTWSRSQSAVPTRLGSASSVWWPRCRQAGCWEGGTQRVMRSGRSLRGWQSPAPPTAEAPPFPAPWRKSRLFPMRKPCCAPPKKKAPPLPRKLLPLPAPRRKSRPSLPREEAPPSSSIGRGSAPPCPQRKLRLLPPAPSVCSRVTYGLTNPPSVAVAGRELLVVFPLSLLGTPLPGKKRISSNQRLHCWRLRFTRALVPPYPSCLQQEEKGQGPPNYSYGFGWQYFRLSPFHHLVGLTRANTWKDFSGRAWVSQALANKLKRKLTQCLCPKFLLCKARKIAQPNESYLFRS